MGEKLDRITTAMGGTSETTLVVVQPMAPDAFFTVDQQRRLGDLMARWRQALDDGSIFPDDEQRELDALIQAEVIAAGDRAAEMHRRLPS